MIARTAERAQERVRDLAGRGLDVGSLWEEVADIVAPLVPHEGGTCFYTLDPASLLVTSHANREMPVLPPEWLRIEYAAGDNPHRSEERRVGKECRL